MLNLNQATIAGNLGKDPVFSTLQNGSEICRFSIVTKMSYQDKVTKEWKEKIEWHQVFTFNPNHIKRIKASVKKGTNLYIEAKLQTRKWTDEKGSDHYLTELEINSFKIVGQPKKQELENDDNAL